MKTKMLLSLCLFAFALSCGSQDTGSADQVEPSETPDASDVPGDSMPPDLMRLPDMTADSSNFELPPSDCEFGCRPGSIRCLSNHTQMKQCTPLDESDCDAVCCPAAWDEPQPCPTNTHCAPDTGCVCTYGECSNELPSSEQCVLPFDSSPVLQWSCEQGCCVPEVGCMNNQECADCVDASTGTVLFPCPLPLPDGFVANLCTSHACNEETGKCLAVEPPEEIAGLLLICPEAACDPATGEYSFPYPNGNCGFCWGANGWSASKKCDDGNLCTLDSCEFPELFHAWKHDNVPDPTTDGKFIGVCEHVDVIANGYCVDGNVCTVDECHPDTGCVHAPLDVPECTCSTDDTCPASTDPCLVPYCNVDDGTCGVTQLDCDDGSICTSDYCEPYPDSRLVPGEYPCAHWTPYNPEHFCTSVEECDCYSPDPGDKCISSLCIWQPGNDIGICDYTEETCNDGNLCTEGTCDPEDGSCHFINVDVDDELDCTTDWCDPTTGIIHHESTPCDDGNPCTIDECLPFAGCVYTVVDDPACTCGSDEDCPPPEDQCITPLCLEEINACSLVPRDCDDNDSCTIDACDSDAPPDSPPCSHTLLSDIGSGPDGCISSQDCACYSPAYNNHCVVPYCIFEPGEALGTCAYVETTCDDGNQCILGWCDPADGTCSFVVVTVDDENPCTTDWCAPGTGEVHNDPVVCDDGNPCTVDSCDESDGDCHSMADDSLACDDADPETSNVCSDGVCVVIEP